MIRKRARSSSMWSYFTIVDGNKKIATCNMCGQNMSFSSTVSNLKSHILRKHPTVNLDSSIQVQFNMSDMVDQTPIPASPTDSRAPVPSPVLSNYKEECSIVLEPLSEGSIQCFESFDPSASSSVPVPVVRQTNNGCYTKKVNAGGNGVIDKALLRLFTKDFQPFTVVEDTGFKNFVSQLNPNYSLPDRKVIENILIPAAYEECRNVVAQKVETAESISLTTVCWSSCAQESYLALTAHFISKDFEFESVMLDCCQIEGSHTSFNLASSIKKILNSFSIHDSKILIVVSDNALNIKSAVINELKWDYFECYAHTLNLIVNNALNYDVIKNIIYKVKNIVKHFKRSDQDQEKFFKYQSDAGEQEPKKLLLNVASSWNSTYYMIERFTALQETVRATLGKEIAPLTVDEWKICRDLCKTLKPFEEVTRKLSGETYVSGSQVVVLTNGLTDVCQKLISRQLHPTAIDVTQRLQEGLVTRFMNIEQNKIIGVCSFLDPRYKLYPFKSSHAQSSIKEHVIKLATAEFNVEKRVDQKPSKEEESVNKDQIIKNERFEQDEEADLSVTDFLDEVLRKAQPPGTAISSILIEVEQYLKERTIDRKEDPLKWWATRQHAYPILAKIFKKRYNVVATSVPCQSIYSKAALMINDQRTWFKTSKVRQLTFLHLNDKYVSNS